MVFFAKKNLVPLEIGILPRSKLMSVRFDSKFNCGQLWQSWRCNIRSERGKRLVPGCPLLFQVTATTSSQAAKAPAAINYAGVELIQDRSNFNKPYVRTRTGLVRRDFINYYRNDNYTCYPTVKYTMQCLAPNLGDDIHMNQRNWWTLKLYRISIKF